VSPLLPPLVRDPGRLRQSLRTAGAAGIAAGVLGVGGAGVGLARAGVDAVIARARPHAHDPVPRPVGLPPVDRPASARLGEVGKLVYELLDAHDDTAQMAAGLAYDPDWQGHLDYLQALQRKGREALAHMSMDAVR
jgi:hypothetical protein